MPFFTYRLNSQATHKFIGSYPCYGWMGYLQEVDRGIPNTPEEHIEAIQVIFNDQANFPQENRDEYMELIMKFCEASPTLKGRVQVNPSFMYRGEASSGNRRAETEAQIESGTEQYGKCLEIELPGIPMDVLMQHCFILRNLAHRQSFYLFKYMTGKGVPIKVAALLSATFYVVESSNRLRGGTGQQWTLGCHSGDSSIFSSATTLTDLRNFAYGTKIKGHQPVWGENERREGYIRDGDYFEGDEYYITNALEQARGERVELRANWTFLNDLVTKLVGQDFEISQEDANAQIQRIGS